MKKLVGLFCAICLTSVAQAAPAASTDSVINLFKNMNMEKNIDAGIAPGVDVLMLQTDNSEATRVRLTKFMRETVGYTSLQSDLFKVYQENFSVSEIDDLNKFYQTPTGHKFAQLQGKLAKEAAQAGQKKLNARQVELSKLLQASRKK